MGHKTLYGLGNGGLMSNRHHTANESLLALTFVSTACLIFIMLAQPLHRNEIFLRRDTVSAIEALMILGYLLLLIFNITSVTWSARRLTRIDNYTPGYAGALVFGVLCIVLLFGDKVMVDEIGRASILGRETLGEWIIL